MLLSVAPHAIMNNMEITDIIDLNGEQLVIPENFTLSFNDGVVRNGIIVGNNTAVIAEDNKIIFEDVIISGTWSVSNIHSSWFSNNENCLQNVLALTSPDKHNTVYINSGSYSVTIDNNAESCLRINSNTDIILNGDIYLKPNGFTHYNIIDIYGNDITLSGEGSIIGDRDRHCANEGEWGMGIMIRKSSNVTINDIIIKDCWGDCIYITEDSCKITIEKCTLVNSRRQGISIIDAKDIIIKDIIFSDIQGTSPEYAIDIEPNQNCSVDNVWIENVDIRNCRGGLLVYGGATNAFIGKVSISDSHISNSRKLPIRIIQNAYISIRNCYITGFPDKAITSVKTDSIVIKGNTIHKNGATNKKSSFGQWIYQLKRNEYIEVNDDVSRIVANNKIIR